MSVSAPAIAQDDDGGRWSVTVTPRYQQLFFSPSPENGEVKSIPTYGGSIAVRNPDGRFGVMGTFMTGKKNNGFYNYEDDGFSGRYRFNVKREEYALTFEYTPSETGVSLLAGYHNFLARENEARVDAPVGDSEVNSYRYKIGAAEAGFRLSSRLGANSRQSLSAQFLVGVGSGRYRVNEKEVIGGQTSTNVGSRKGTGYLGDIAIGYNIFLTDNISLGARARGYVFFVDAKGADPIFAAAPEANLSVRF
ncbi:hypothetical protein HJG53_11035 [Sphingomonas sp. ID1715]|nr:hypothetical protein [Sphingomonas sp. ID1715]